MTGATPRPESRDRGVASKVICVICSGNICRSPYGEGALRKLVIENGWDLEVISAGTLGIDDRPAHDHSRTVGLERGVDLSDHRSQGISRAIVGASDLLLCMSPGHMEEIGALFESSAGKTFLFGAYPSRGRDTDDIPDPIGKPIEVFRECFDAIDQAVARIGEDLARW